MTKVFCENIFNKESTCSHVIMKKDNYINTNCFSFYNKR